MKKLKSILSALTMSVMVFGSSFCANSLDYCDSLTYIISGDCAVITGFKGSPEVINLPSKIDGFTVTEIRENSFYKCNSLKKIVIPESVCKIGHHAFFECEALETAEINGNISKIPEGIFYGCEKLENISISSAPVSVENYAFFDCRSLSGFEVPRSVTDIGAYSFAGCTELSEISLNRELQNIGAYSFYNCFNLDKIKLPDRLLSIGQCAIGFSDNGVLKNVTITGLSDSIAQSYAESNSVRFQNRVYYEKNSIISGNTVAGILAWISFAAIYVLLMLLLYSKTKTKKKHLL